MLNVRVITPIYRFKDNYLRQALDSVAAQDYKGYIDHVVVWDGWTRKQVENTVAFKIKARQFYHETRKGVSMARNIGLAMGQHSACPGYTDLVCYLDSDNWMNKDFVSQMVDGYKSMPEPGVFVCAQRVHYYQQILHGVTAEVRSQVRGGYVPGNYRALLLDHNWIDLGTIIHPFDPGITFDTNLTRLVDWDLLIQLAQKYPFAATDKVLSHYRMHALPWAISKVESFSDNRAKLVKKWQ